MGSGSGSPAIFQGFQFARTGKRRRQRFLAELIAEQRKQRAREEEARAGIRGEIAKVGDLSQLRQRAGLEDISRRFDVARQQTERGLRQRGLTGRAGQELARLGLAQAGAESQAIRQTRLGDEQRRLQLVQALTQLNFRAPPSLGIASQLEQSGLQQLLGALGFLGGVSQVKVGVGGFGGGGGGSAGGGGGGGLSFAQGASFQGPAIGTGAGGGGSRGF